MNQGSESRVEEWFTSGSEIKYRDKLQTRSDLIGLRLYAIALEPI